MPSVTDSKFGIFSSSPDKESLADAERKYWGPKQGLLTPWQNFSLPDLKHAALAVLTGQSPNLSTPDLERIWLLSQAGLPSNYPGTINDLWSGAVTNKAQQDLINQALVLIDPRRAPQGPTLDVLTNWGTSRTVVPTAQLGSTATADTNDPIWLPYKGEDYIYLPGVAGNYVSTPDSVKSRPGPTLEIVARIKTAGQVQSDIIAKTSSTGSYLLRIANTSGILEFVYWDNTITLTQTYSAAFLTFPYTGWVKVTHDSTTGNTTFYSAPDSPTEPTNWTAGGGPTNAPLPESGN